MSDSSKKSAVEPVLTAYRRMVSSGSLEEDSSQVILAQKLDVLLGALFCSEKR